MPQNGLDDIRNLAFLSHSGAGKTSVGEAVLYNAKVTTRLGKVDEGNTISDYDPDEVKRRISINLAVLTCQWKGNKLNLLDTPGYSDFAGEVKAAIRVSDGAVIMVCAASGVEVGTEQVWDYSETAALPRLILANKMDRENADFYRTVEELHSKFGARCIPVQLPVGSQSSFSGVIDLVTMKGYLGTKAEEAEIPDELSTRAAEYREKLVEAVAETDDTLIEKYLEGGEISTQELIQGLRQATISGKMVPVLAGSALRNIGIHLLADAVGQYLPSPGERATADSGKPDMESPLAALVFKTSADPYVGKLTYFRVYNGTMTSNSQVWNSARNEMERIGQLFVLRGKTQEPVPQLTAGDIGAVAKLNVTLTGDTLCQRDNPVKMAPIEFPEPVFGLAVHPRGKADVDKMGTALARLVEEDPSLRMQRDSDTGEVILSGLGSTHLEVAGEKMAHKFGVNVELDTPKVPYKETITVAAKAQYKHKKQTGGHGQYGHVLLEVEPLPRGSGAEFADKIVGGSIPRNYIPAVEKGVNEALREGVLGGYPVVDVRATVYDGSFHPVDSSEICFKIAGAGALKRGMLEGQPKLLEPIMNISITVPQDYTGDIISDLNSKRARMQGMNPQGGTNVIEAQAPLAEIIRYAIDLKSITQGRGSYAVSFSHYEEVPGQIAERIITQRQAEKAA